LTTTSCKLYVNNDGSKNYSLLTWAEMLWRYWTCRWTKEHWVVSHTYHFHISLCILWGLLKTIFMKKCFTNFIAPKVKFG